MERSELLKRLAQVEQQVSNETEMIARQRKMLAELHANEVDTDAIQIMLASLENLLVLHLQEREKLRAALAKLDGSS
jgi:hypothetical protein